MLLVRFFGMEVFVAKYRIQAVAIGTDECTGIASTQETVLGITFDVFTWAFFTGPGFPLVRVMATRAANDPSF